MGKLIVCKECEKEKEHGGLRRCKSCYDRFHYRENRERLLAQRNRYNQEHREARCQYARDYYQKYQDKVLANCRRYYQDHRDKVKIRHLHWREKNPNYSRRWAKENPERVRMLNCRWGRQNPERKAASEARRKARKQNLPNTLTEGERKELFLIGQATYPNQKLHLDHVVPISKGGGTTRANVHYIPAKVNLSKKDKLVAEIYIQLPLGG